MRIITFGNMLMIVIMVVLYNALIHIISYRSEIPDISRTPFNEYYSHSNLDVYYEGERIASADKKTFSPLSVPFYGKDKNKVFWGKREIMHADSPSFEMVDGNYSKDKNKVYFRGRPLLQSDPKTFTVLKHTDQFAETIYAKDQSYVYLERYIIPHADPATFKLLNGDWAKDKNFVYYMGRLLPEIDANSFKSIHYVASDKIHPYDKGNFVAGIDGETFERLSSGHYYQDKNYVYSYPKTDRIFYGLNQTPIMPKDFIYIKNIERSTGRDFSYYRTPNNICFHYSNGERVWCEEE